MMKVSELAEELKVSRQTIYNHIDKLKPEIDKHIDKVKGAKVIELAGIKMIRASVNDKSSFDNETDSKTDEEKARLYHRQIELWEKQVEQLESQLEMKDQQIERLHIMIQQSQKNVEQLTGEVREESFIDKVKSWFR